METETKAVNFAKAAIKGRQKASTCAEGTADRPLLYASQPAAGFPAPADDLVEKALDINDLVVENPASTFFVRVAGDSMEGAGIFSGDVLVVDSQSNLKTERL